jgi:hypothetical protein
MVNDGILDSQSNAAAYDQVSYAQARKDFRNFKTYQYNQITSSENFIVNSFGATAFARYMQS